MSNNSPTAVAARQARQANQAHQANRDRLMEARAAAARLMAEVERSLQEEEADPATAAEKVAAVRDRLMEVRAAAGIDRETARNWNKE